MSILDWWRKQPKPPEREEPKARGGSGRGHSSGFLELEELNSDLLHPLSHFVYDRMYRTDADIRQVMRLCINPILGGTWSVEPYGGQEAEERDIEVASDVEWALWEFMRPNLIGHLARFLPIAFRSGFGPGEIVWGACERDGRTLLAPKTIETRLPRSVWRWEQKGGTLVAVHQYLPAGSPRAATDNEYKQTYGTGGANPGMPGSVRLDARNLVYYRVDDEGDNWEGVSLLRSAYKHWYIKDKIERIDAVAQEREAIGVPICYPPAGASKPQLDEMEKILQNLQTNEQGYIIMPGQKAGVSGTPDSTGWLLELIGFDRTGSGRDPRPSLEYHTNKIAAAFIAEFMRLGHGGSDGARATAQVQADPFLLAIESLVTTIVETELNDKIVAPFVAYNYDDVSNMPKLKMSLVDSTSLSQLADFVLKLTQVGALLPDQELEEFLRARADMPPPNPESVRKRGEDEEMIRRQIVGGNINPTPLDEQNAELAKEQAAMGAQAGVDQAKVKVGQTPKGDPYGSNDKKNRGTKHVNKGGIGRKSGAPSGEGGKGQGAPRGPAKNLAAAYVDSDGVVGFHGASRWYEAHMDLDGIDEYMASMPNLLQHYCGAYMHALAAEMGAADTPVGEAPAGSGARQAMREELSACLNSAYTNGSSFVIGELEAQGFDMAGRTLDRGARDRGAAHLADRARLAAEAVELSMRQAMLGHDLAHGELGRAQAAAEKAGMAALRRAGFDHGVAAFVHGRHDTATQLAEGDERVRVIYSALLDSHCCEHCHEADDGVARRLDDPVRVSRMPPNPFCESTASGHNRCRCMESYVIEDDDRVTLSEPTPVGELHPYLARIVTHLVARGMPAERAFAVAVRVARQVAIDGKVRWPGLRQVGAGDTEGARSAVAWIESRGG